MTLKTLAHLHNSFAFGDGHDALEEDFDICSFHHFFPYLKNNKSQPTLGHASQSLLFLNLPKAWGARGAVRAPRPFRRGRGFSEGLSLGSLEG